MVNKLMRVLGREISGLHEAAYLLGAFALLSQLLGLVRDKLLTFTFGAGHALDIYYAAFRIPDLMFVSIGSLVAASVLLPFFIDYFARGEEAGKHFFDSMFTVFFSLMVVVCAVMFFLLPRLIPIVIPGFAGDPMFSTLVASARIMLLSPLFLGLSNLFSSVTQMRQRFLVYAASPVAYNLSIIVGVLVFYPLVGLTGLAWGVALGAFLHASIQIPFMSHHKLIPRFISSVEWGRVKKAIFVSLPRTVTLAANQIASFVLVALASLMNGGSIAIFTIAYNLQSVPLTIVGASYSSAVFPALSKLYVGGNRKDFLEKMIASSRHIIFWTVPITVLFIVLRAQIVRVIYGAGKFDWSDTRLTAATLALFIISAVGQSLVTLFVRAYYAEGKTRRPLFVNLVASSSIVGLGFFLAWAFGAFPLFRYFLEDLLKVSGQAGTSVLVLPLAFTLGVLLNTYLHWHMFERDYPGFSRPVLSTLYHSFSASVLMGYAAFVGLRIFSFFPLEHVWGLLLQGLCAGILGIAVGVGVLLLLGNREIREIWKTLHHKIWRTQVPPPEVEHL